MVVVPAAYGGTSPRASDDKVRVRAGARVGLGLGRLPLPLPLTLTPILTLILTLTLTKELWLRPFSEAAVWPMSLTPQPEPLQQAAQPLTLT